MARVTGRYGLLLAVVAAVLLGCTGTVLAQSTGPGDNGQSQRAYQSAESLQFQEPGSGKPGALSATQKRAIEQGYLVPDQGAYEQAKDEANAESLGESDEDISPAGAQDPQTIRSFEGLKDPNAGPSDSTGAIGTDRYIELVNSKFAIYDRTNDDPISTGSLNELVGERASANVFDPQIIWDPDTNRFFYTADDVLSAQDNRLAFGFSKTATPSSADDFCQYAINYGKKFPDYPKLGDTQNFILIGVNTFKPKKFVGSDLNSISKPPPGSACPSADTFMVDRFENLESNGKRIFTPVPANQTDGSDTGYIVARPLSVPASELSIFEATENAGSIDLSVSNLAVPMYSIPASATQPGKKSPRLDTLDTRNTQALSAIDPSQGNQVALWTQHTVSGGAGAQVRWYEIDPSVPALFQSGDISSSKSFIFNGAISPDRLVNGATTAFGDSMVLGFNISAKKQRPSINMVSKVGSGAVSDPVLIKSSSDSLDDFSCSPGVCRWGDYSAATPDPGASSSADHGQVWLSNQWVRRTGGNSGSGWGTWNWAATP